MALTQQTVNDPASLLTPPDGWREIYSQSYQSVFAEPAGTLATVSAIEFYGVNLGALQLLGPDQVRALAQQFDATISQLMAQNGSVVYGSKIFWVVQASVSIPLLGTLAVDRYRYVVAHRAVS